MRQTNATGKNIVILGSREAALPVNIAGSLPVDVALVSRDDTVCDITGYAGGSKIGEDAVFKDSIGVREEVCEGAGDEVCDDVRLESCDEVKFDEAEYEILVCDEPLEVCNGLEIPVLTEVLFDCVPVGLCFEFSVLVRPLL
jgi:hypothetical protein